MEKVTIDAARTKKGYSCVCSLLPGWVVAYEGDFDGFRQYVAESIAFRIESAREDGEDYPDAFNGEYLLEYKFDVQSLLEAYRGIFSFSALQKITGINQKQLSHYAAGISKPRRVQADKIARGLHKLADELRSITL